jgi:ATP:ADP antiporter, AAA family
MRGDRRERLRVPLATATLFLLIAGHAVRETARDALFLTDLPATRLPWAYLAIAFGALMLGVANRHLLARFSHRRLLLYTLCFAALVDTAFWGFGEAGSHLDLFALYAWTGLVGTAVSLQLWLHLADSFTVTEAKRTFPWITAGGLAGAVVGSLLARALLEVLDTRSLLLATAALPRPSRPDSRRGAPSPKPHAKTRMTPRARRGCATSRPAATCGGSSS